MKQLKKMAAVLLAFMLVLTLMPANSIADEPTSKLIVQGVEDGAVVSAYKLTEADFTADGGFKGYKNLIKDASGKDAFANPSEPKTSEWSALLNKPVGELGNAIPLTQASAGGAYESAPQGAGLYMILVTSKEGKKTVSVYNPMLVGISYKKATDGTETAEGGSISVPANFQLGKDAVLYAKKSDVTLTKTTKDPSEETQSTLNGQAGESNKGNGLGLGEKPNFKIETTIPSYATTDQNLVFKIEDTLDEGLTPPKPEEITVKVGGQAITAGDTTAKIAVNGQKITIDFVESYLQSLGKETAENRKVEITYSATLNDKATVNFKANENNVSLTYTNDPKTENGKKTITDKTYHYTFDIDGLLNGEGSETSHEITKHHDKTDTTTWKDLPLEGAKFGLFDKDPSDQTAKMLQDVTTDDTGRMNFKKLDEGVYYIKEIQAPNGYSLNDKVYTVEITADYNTDGTLKSYSITINDEATTTFTAVDVADDTDEIKDGVITNPDTPTLINNTPLPGLPTTGGMGTYLFTGIGVALLAGAAVMVTVLRKKNGQTTR